MPKKICLACAFTTELADEIIHPKCPNCERYYHKVESQIDNGKLDVFYDAASRSQLTEEEIEDLKLKIVEKNQPPQVSAGDGNNIIENFNKSINESIDLSKKQKLGIAGSLLLFFGAFTPIISMPMIGNVSYFHNGKGDGVIILVLAIISLFLVFKNKYEKLFITGGLSLLILMFTFINFQLEMSAIKEEMEMSLADNPFRGIADMAMQSVQLQWGWAVLLIAVGLVFYSAICKEDL